MSDFEKLESFNPEIVHSPEAQEALSGMLPGVSVKLKPGEGHFSSTIPIPIGSEMPFTPKPTKDGVAIPTEQPSAPDAHDEYYREKRRRLAEEDRKRLEDKARFDEAKARHISHNILDIDSPHKPK